MSTTLRPHVDDAGGLAQRARDGEHGLVFGASNAGDEDSLDADEAPIDEDLDGALRSGEDFADRTAEPALEEERSMLAE